MSIAAVSLVALGVAWSALWVFAGQEAKRNLAAWIDAERRQGRLWTCPDRHIGGFPLAITVSCSKPAFAEAGNAAFRGELAGLRAEAPLYRPDDVAIALAGPLTIAGDSVAGLTVGWSSAELTLRGVGPGRFDNARLEGRGIAIAATGLAASVRIERGDVDVRPLPQTAAGPPDVELTVGLEQVNAPDADPLFGSTDPIAATILATVRKVPNRGASLPTLLEAWRAAGGQLDIGRFDVAKGVFHAGGAGELQVDDSHRLAGRLEAHVAGLEPIAARYGIPLGAVKVGGLLAGLFGGKSTPAEPPQADLTLPLVIRAGRLYVGPVKTGVVLAPLY